jgi:glycosyltransferase involved in cell wall biosynthesis
VSAPHLPPGWVDEPARGAPPVTIVTACLNAARTIGATLASVAAQTAPVEHIVIDGGSTDGTVALARAARHGPRVVSEPDHGIYDAFDKGLALARGEWIAFLNADDRYAHPRVVARALEEARPDVDIIHADQRWYDERGRLARVGWFVPRSGARDDYAQLLRLLPVWHQTTFCRRGLFARIGGFDRSYRVAGDYDFFLRAWLADARFRYVPEVFVEGRSGGLSERLRSLSDLEVVRAWSRHARPGAPRVAARLGRLLATRLLERHAAGPLAWLRALRAPPTWGRRSRDVRSWADAEGEGAGAGADAPGRR